MMHLADRFALRPVEAARALGITARTLRTWMRHEGLPYFRLGGAVLIPVPELQAWIAERVRSEHRADELAEEAVRGL